MTWFQTGVFYQIFTRSFVDSNGDGFGDLNGIASHLDYVEALGVDAIRLTPIFSPPGSASASYPERLCEIDPRYGTQADFDNLLMCAHARGIRLVLDLPNHLFGSSPDKDLLVQKGKGWSHSQQFLDALRFWMERGVDGLRIAIDEPGSPHIPEGRGDQSDPVLPIRTLRELIDSYSSPGQEKYLLGERMPEQRRDWTFAARCSQPGLLDAALYSEFVDLPWRVRPVISAVQQWEHQLGADRWPAYAFNVPGASRSTVRWRQRLFASAEDDARARTAAVLLLTLRGAPFLYYGEEIGMRDLSRQGKGPRMASSLGPMQWDRSTNAGFGAGAAPWLPPHPDATWRNVDRMSSDPTSLLNLYRRIIALRRSTPALSHGMFLPVTYGTRFLVAYLRQTTDQTVLVALNFTGRKQRLVLGSHLARAGWRLLFSTHRSIVPPIRKALLPLDPHEALILEMQ